MKNAWFEPIERQLALRKELETWLGTRFRQGGSLKGVGADCVHFIGLSFLAIGAIDRMFDVPEYDIDHSVHSSHSLLLEWFDRPENRRRVRRVDEDESPMTGDLIFPKLRQGVHHLGCRDVTPQFDRVWHAVRPHGVVTASMALVRAQSIQFSSYRLLEP